MKKKKKKIGLFPMVDFLDYFLEGLKSEKEKNWKQKKYKMFNLL